jgi:ribosomal-protein-alanine N-acetyltransferase
MKGAQTMQYAAFHALETKRLSLRKLRLSDLPEYNLLYGDRQVCRYMLFDPHESLSQSEASLHRALRRYGETGFYRWAIARKTDDRLIGIIDLLRFDEKTDSCSFAYMLCPDFWNRGYGTEAVKAVFRFAFDEMGIQTIAADHMAENPASGAVMRKAGMTFVHRIEGKYEKNGASHDSLCYEIRKENFHDGE